MIDPGEGETAASMEEFESHPIDSIRHNLLVSSWEASRRHCPRW